MRNDRSSKTIRISSSRTWTSWIRRSRKRLRSATCKSIRHSDRFSLIFFRVLLHVFNLLKGKMSPLVSNSVSPSIMSGRTLYPNSLEVNVRFSRFPSCLPCSSISQLHSIFSMKSIQLSISRIQRILVLLLHLINNLFI